MNIVKLQKSDIKNALNLAWAVFQECAAPDYSQQGIEEFKEFLSYSYIAEKFEKGELSFWGCKDNGYLTGVIATRGINHICMLFVKQEYQKRGIAKSLFQTVKERCKNRYNINRITVYSTPYAVKVYHRLGFVDTSKEQIVNGFRFTPMLYFLE